MKLLAIGAVFATIFATAATADSRYDQKLEQAVMAIVAAKIGDIRGGFSYDSRPVFVTAPDPMPAGTTAQGMQPPAGDGWTNGLAVAIERKATLAVAY